VPATYRDSLCILSSNQRQYLTNKLGDYLKEHCANGIEQVQVSLSPAQLPLFSTYTYICNTGSDVACAGVALVCLHPQAGTVGFMFVSGDHRTS
jgi:hypothetical protein